MASSHLQKQKSNNHYAVIEELISGKTVGIYCLLYRFLTTFDNLIPFAIILFQFTSRKNFHFATTHGPLPVRNGHYSAVWWSL